jgi:purine-binding chemotaxis protein CheW
VTPAVLEVLVFELAGRRYGLPTADVREVLPALTIVPLPRAPAVVEGIINLRGVVVPVLGIRSRFHLPPRELAVSDHLIVAQLGDRPLALRVDRVTELIRLDSADIEDARGLPGVEYVAWVAKRSEDLVLIHDLRTFLSRTEAAELAAALPGPADGLTREAEGGPA